MIPLVHNYSFAAGKTLYWDTSDNKDAYLKNIQDPEKKKKLNDLGFLDADITYQFNSHGFRNTEFDHNIDILCFGCSFTMGTGVANQHTWPAQLEKITGMTVANLGHAGSSNDTVFRFANHYLKIIKPTVAIWQQTDMHRLELLDEQNSLSLNIMANDTINPCAQDYFIKNWFGFPVNQQLNLLKNTLAFQQLCSLLNIKFIILPRENIHCDGRARDLMHPGAEEYKRVANNISILLGHPDYLA
jgi:hypothetical protein